jgi:hypothetical protein
MPVTAEHGAAKSARRGRHWLFVLLVPLVLLLMVPGFRPMTVQLGGSVVIVHLERMRHPVPMTLLPAGYTTTVGRMNRYIRHDDGQAYVSSGKYTAHQLRVSEWVYGVTWFNWRRIE